MLKRYGQQGVEQVKGVVIQVQACGEQQVIRVVGVLVEVEQRFVEPPEVPDMQPGVAPPGERDRVAQVKHQGKSEQYGPAQEEQRREKGA